MIFFQNHIPPHLMLISFEKRNLNVENKEERGTGMFVSQRFVQDCSLI